MTKPPQRPLCPKCGMHMTEITPIKNSKQTVECLRCGHVEIRTIREG